MTVMARKPLGRPPKFTSVADLQKRIDKYFEDCNGKPLLDQEGMPVLNKWGEPVMIGREPLTITGLALAIGFNGRQQLLDYQAKDAFHDTIVRAKARVERYAEQRLFDKDGANGAKFALSNNYAGWAEKKEIKAEVSSGDIANLPPTVQLEVYKRAIAQIEQQLLLESPEQYKISE